MQIREAVHSPQPYSLSPFSFDRLTEDIFLGTRAGEWASVNTLVLLLSDHNQYHLQLGSLANPSFTVI